MSDHTTLVRTAASAPFSLLTTENLTDAGFDRHGIDSLLAERLLFRVRRGWFSLVPPDWIACLAAAFLQVGSAAVVSHRSAARLHGLLCHDDLDLTVRYPTDARPVGVRVHRSRDIGESDVITLDEFRATSLIRTLCDLGLVLPPCEVERLVDHSIATGLVDTPSLLAERRRLGEHGRDGVGMIDTALDGLPELAGLTESGPELKLLKLISRSQLPNPVPQHPVSAFGHRYRIDLAYPALRIALEFDGADWHSAPQQLRNDRTRQANLEAIGWRVFRYVWSDLGPANDITTIARLREAIETRTHL